MRASAFLLLGALACGPGHRPRYVRPASLPDALVIRVDRVSVLPVRSGTSEPWDAATSEETPKSGCQLLGLVAEVGSSMLGEIEIAPSMVGRGVELLCGMTKREPRAERDARNPDLRLRFGAGPGVRFESRTLRDTLSAAFQYALVVPSRAIPPEGLLLEVLDDDASPEPESIGSVRLSSALLRRALAAPGGLLEFRQGGVTRLEIVVVPYTPIELPQTKLSAAEGARAVVSRPLAAGEILELRATGNFSVGRWYDEKLGPEGYSSDAAQRYNFEQQPFASAPHGCAIALIGEGGTVQGTVVGSSRTFMAYLPGPLRIGVNDIDPANNRGVLTFTGRTRAPTPREWSLAQLAHSH